MGFLRILLKKNTALLLSSQLISNVGSIMQTVALALFVLKQASGIQFASVLAVGMIPRLFGSFTGVVTDRVNRKHLLVVLDIIAGVFTLGFAFIYQYGGGLPLPMIYILVLTLSSVQTFYDPTVSAILPDIVQSKHLVETNSASSFITNISYIAVPALAGLLYSGYGLFPVMALNGISFFFAAALEALISYRQQPHIEQARREPVFRSFQDGLSHVLGNKELLMIVVISIAANLALNPIFTVGLPYILNVDLKVSPQLYGLSQSMLFIGPVLGSIVAGLVLKRVNYKRLIMWILLVDSVLVFSLGLLTVTGTLYQMTLQFLLINTAAFIIISTMVLASIALMTAIQKIVPSALMGRVMGVVTSFSIAAIPLGQWLFGLGLDTYKSMATCISFSILVLGAALLSIIVYRPMLRQEGASAAKGENAAV